MSDLETLRVMGELIEGLNFAARYSHMCDARVGALSAHARVPFDECDVKRCADFRATVADARKLVEP